MTSKRLLSEHIEILDDYLSLREIHEPPSNVGRYARLGATTIGGFAVGGGLLMKTAGNVKMLAGLGVCSLGLGLGIVAVRESREMYSNWRDIQGLSKLLEKLGQYHISMKRNLTYCNDSILFNGGKSAEQDELLSVTCTQSLVHIIKILHKLVSDLDEKSSITSELPNYQPFEDLGDYDAMLEGERDVHTFKNLYAIYLYIQSQFALRICINLVEKEFQIDDKFESISKELVNELQRKDLRILSRRTIETEKAIKCSDLIAKLPQGDPRVEKLKYTSSNVLKTLVVQLNQFERFHESLLKLEQKDLSTKKLQKINEELILMETLFVTSNCDFEHVQILLKKIINGGKETEKLAIENGGKLKTEDPELTRNVVDQSTPITIDDEFFILDGQLTEREQMGSTDANPDDSRSELILKSTFKPVLRQLRKQIDPLKEQMIARERKFLEQKGVQVPAVNNDEVKSALYSDVSSTESEDEELDDNLVLRRKEKQPRPSKYDENRRFLEEKVQMGVFRFPPPVNFCASEEDVLE